MANLRVFISSTYYDLKHVRSYVSDFITKMGYEPTLSEKGQIAYDPAIPLDESCYRDAKTTDILVLVIGGRYGSATSEANNTMQTEGFYERYESVTQKEFESANKNGIPTYILVEKSVMLEYETFKKNRKNETVIYAYVDSINIFHFIDAILAKNGNNPLFQFDQPQEIEAWLKNQWSGYFRTLLEKKSQNQQLNSLSQQVGELNNINKSLQRYLEKVIENVAGESSESIIKNEHVALMEENINRRLLQMPMVMSLVECQKFSLDEVKKIYRGSSIKNTIKSLSDACSNYNEEYLHKGWKDNPRAVGQVNDIREILQEPKLYMK